MLISKLRHIRSKNFEKKICLFCGIGACSLIIASCTPVEERIANHYERGQELLSENTPNKAELEFRNALRLNNDFVPALVELAKLESAKGEYSKAVNIYQKIIELEPEHRDALHELGKIYLSARRLDDAERLINSALQLAPNDASILATKAALALSQRLYQEAVTYANESLALAPGNADALTVLATERLAANDPNGALKYLEQEQERPNESALTALEFLKLAALESLSRDDEIEAVLLKTTQRLPENQKLHLALAKWYYDRNRKIDAEETLRNFYEQNTDNLEAGLQLIQFIGRERGNNAAISELERLIDTNDEQSFEYELILSQLLFSNGQDQSKAFDILNRLIADAQDLQLKSRAQVALAEKYMALEDIDRAREILGSVLDSDRENTSALRLSANIMLSESREDEAIEYLLRALELDPQSIDILQALALAYERQGKIDLAEDHLVKAARLEEFKPRMGLNLASF